MFTMDPEIVIVLSNCRRDGVSPVKALRLYRGMTLNELAYAARMDPAHVDLIEHQSGLANPSLAELEALAKALGLGVAALLPEKKSPSSRKMRGEQANQLSN